MHKLSLTVHAMQLSYTEKATFVTMPRWLHRLYYQMPFRLPGLAQSHITLAATRHSLLTAKQDWICAEEFTCSPRNSFLSDKSTPNMAFSWCRIFFIVMVCNQPSAEREPSAECLLYDLARRTEAQAATCFAKGQRAFPNTPVSML